MLKKCKAIPLHTIPGYNIIISSDSKQHFRVSMPKQK